MKTISEKSRALCYAIEAAGASNELTNLSILASQLSAEITTEHLRLLALYESMKRFVAEYYPPDEKGQVDFVRVLVEGYADEIIGPIEEPEPAK